MKKLIAIAFIVSHLPTMALGSTLCAMGKIERKIEIVYKTEGAKVPCEVTYTKEGGDSKVIYSAQAKEGYCEEKATEFAGKLTERGFACSQVAEASSPTAPAK